MRKLFLFSLLAVGFAFLLHSVPVYATAGTWSASGATLFYSDGNVGVGTSLPSAPFSVGGAGASTSLSIINSTANASDWRISSVGNSSSVGKLGDFSINKSGLVPFVIKPTGNIGINTQSPHYALSVNGTILAREIIVSTNANDWADYVFSPSYKLKPLSEVETYIQKNNHLPGISSAKEIASKGQSIGDMQKKQMEKIEELTLYAIQQQKEIDMLKALITK